jgi:hypothetical protein
MASGHHHNWINTSPSLHHTSQKESPSAQAAGSMILPETICSTKASLVLQVN